MPKENTKYTVPLAGMAVYSFIINEGGRKTIARTGETIGTLNLNFGRNSRLVTLSFTAGDIQANKDEKVSFAICIGDADNGVGNWGEVTSPAGKNKPISIHLERTQFLQGEVAIHVRASTTAEGTELGTGYVARLQALVFDPAVKLNPSQQ